MAHAGIDLGTSNTLVAVVSQTGEPEIRQIDGLPMVPSIIYVEEQGGNVTVGRAARDMWADPAYEASRSFRRWKLRMGDEQALATLSMGKNGRAQPLEVTPEFLTARMVEYVVNQLGDGLGGERIESVLVTVPHGWRRENPEKCRSTRVAATQARSKAGVLKVQEITVSEPVAAAAYWTWRARTAGSGPDLEGKTVLVCDMGGGTFDVSLIRVGAADRPLDVIDAANNESAGDHADALVCAWACREFNAAEGTSHPATADEVIERLADPESGWIRGWFLKAQEVKESLSLRIDRALSRGGIESVKPVTVDLADGDGRHRRLSMDVPTFSACLEPLYRTNREFLEAFLKGLPEARWPHAVVFAGGGSRIFGIRELVVRPALAAVMTARRADEILARIPVSSEKLDQVIALGAALIANGVVSVQERLLHNVGMVGCVPAILAKQLGLPHKDQEILLTPILPKGVALPAVVANRELGLNTAVDPGESLKVEVVVDDDTVDPWVQPWVIPHPGGGRQQTIDWKVTADTDGVLTVNLVPQKGETLSLEGRVERKRSGRAKLIFGSDSAVAKNTLPRVTPAQLKQAIEDLRKVKG